MEATDVQLDDDGDLLIKDGDFVADLSDETHIEHILITTQGTARQFPALGVGIVKNLLGAVTKVSKNQLEKSIRVNLIFDGFRIRKLNVESLEDIQIDAIRI